MSDFDPPARGPQSVDQTPRPETALESLDSYPAPDNPDSQGAEDFASDFAVRFWGVRGSVPTPGIDMVRYGGNTSCVEMQVAGQRLVFDGGTGLRVLGRHLLQQQQPVEAHIFFTHSHWDRIQGFPFFDPAFKSGNQFHIYGAAALNGASIKQRLTEQMLRPNFDTPIHTMQSALQFHDLVPGDTFTLNPDITVETVPLNQPNRAIGYRVTWQGYSVVYATDTEHSSDHLDPNLLHLARQADLLIYDATYTEIDQHLMQTPHVGREGHSTWQSGIEVAKAAGVKRIVMYHHDPAHNDDFLDQIEAQVQSVFSQGFLAREGMILKIA